MNELEVSSLAESPSLLYYHDTNLLGILQRNRTAWNSLVADRTLLPTPFIRLYDSNGENCGRYIYNGGTVESSQCGTCTSQTTMHKTENSTFVATGETPTSLLQATATDMPSTSYMYLFATNPKMPSASRNCVATGEIQTIQP